MGRVYRLSTQPTDECDPLVTWLATSRHCSAFELTSSRASLAAATASVPKLYMPVWSLDESVRCVIALPQLGMTKETVEKRFEVFGGSARMLFNDGNDIRKIEEQLLLVNPGVLASVLDPNGTNPSLQATSCTPNKNMRVVRGIYLIAGGRKKWDGRQWRRVCCAGNSSAASRGTDKYCTVHLRGHAQQQQQQQQQQQP
jgi:hypothetical protein